MKIKNGDKTIISNSLKSVTSHIVKDEYMPVSTDLPEIECIFSERSIRKKIYEDVMKQIEAEKFFIEKYKEFLMVHEDIDEDPEHIYTEMDKKLLFISEYIFELITYDDDLSVKITKEFLEICRIIFKRKTFDYFKKDVANEINYIKVVNYTFFLKNINWGTSIRGARFNEEIVIQRSNLSIKMNTFFNYMFNVFLKENNEL